VARLFEVRPQSALKTQPSWLPCQRAKAALGRWRNTPSRPSANCGAYSQLEDRTSTTGIIGYSIESVKQPSSRILP